MIRLEGMMIVLIEMRASVAQAYLDGFERFGVMGLHLEPGEFEEWIRSCGPAEVSAVEAVIAGDFDGREAIPRMLQGQVQSAAIALVDRRSLENTLGLFAAGFDDVVAKPVHVQELLARASRIGKRSKDAGPVATASQLSVFADGRDPVVNGVVLCLPRRERRILECLFQSAGAWMTKTQIFNRVYGVFNDQFDESVIESHICRLRRRLKTELGYDPVESQRYLGYRLSLLRPSGAQGAASPGQSHRGIVAQAMN
ncbi:MAG TPA: response regulator transcription factor [Hyphomicrobium sp.]|nr:response regulator transcription factor [Hyphomicrobium sp.]